MTQHSTRLTRQPTPKKLAVFWPGLGILRIGGKEKTLPAAGGETPDEASLKRGHFIARSHCPEPAAFCSPLGAPSSKPTIKYFGIRLIDNLHFRIKYIDATRFQATRIDLKTQ
jgi:hypothetical protein